MVYPRHYRLEWGGDFVSDPQEIWSNSLRLAPPDNQADTVFEQLDAAGSQAAVNAYGAKVVAHHTASGAGYSSNVRLQYVKLNLIGPDGKQLDQANSWRFDVAGDGTPGVGTPQHALTHSTVITLLTIANRGRASKGRVFVPHSSLAATSTAFRYSTSSITTTAGIWRSFLVALNTPPAAMAPNTPRVSVVSNLETPGLWRNVRAAQVGDFPDYMGSRRNRTTEVRVTSQNLT